MYADDTHAYISLYLDNEINFASSLIIQNILLPIFGYGWLHITDTKTNPYLASPHYVKLQTLWGLQMGTCSITTNGLVKCTWIICDKYINIYEHVTSIYLAVNYHLKNVHCLNALLTQEALVNVVRAFVKYLIDDSNSL